MKVLTDLGGVSVQETVSQSVKTARATGTCSAYTSHVRDFVIWCKEYKYSKELPQVRTLYLCHLWNEKRFKKLFAVKPALDWEFGEIVGEQKEVADIVLDSARRCAPPVKHREKILKSQVDSVLAASMQDSGNWALRRFSVFVGVGFFGLLRISEICALKWAHVSFSDSCLVIEIPKSKTDQFCTGADVRIDFGNSSLFKSVFQKYMSSVDANQEDFVVGDKHGKRVTIGSWRSMFKSMGSQYGIKQPPHGLRGGGASFALANGLPEEAVRRIGRWKSELGMKPYIDPLIVPAIRA